jgi:hypothetical protein
MGGVSLGMRLEEEGEGAGTVSKTAWFGLRMWVEVMQAPVALMLRVRVSSTNSVPEASEALRNTGTCKRILGERRARSESTRTPSFIWSIRRSIGSES